MRLAADNAAYRRTGRVFRYIRPRLSAAIPRSGKSQRHAVVLGALLAALPAAWFSLAPARTTTLDLAVVGVTAFAGAAWLRLLFVGAKHWVWVDPRCGKLVRRPSKQRPPRWWWRYRLSSDT